LVFDWGALCEGVGSEESGAEVGGACCASATFERGLRMARAINDHTADLIDKTSPQGI
jgi:hypothetical protein